MLLSSIDVNAEKDSKDDVDLNERKESNETTTSIKINDDSFRNRTNKIRENVSVGSFHFLKQRCAGQINCN